MLQERLQFVIMSFSKDVVSRVIELAVALKQCKNVLDFHDHGCDFNVLIIKINKFLEK